ncbi:MAG: hypothetical protein ACLFPA_00985 [Dichotomicrobium sp.]
MDGERADSTYAIPDAMAVQIAKLVIPVIRSTRRVDHEGVLILGNAKPVPEPAARTASSPSSGAGSKL